MDFNNLYKEFGRRLKHARKTADLTQLDLANKVGLSRASITNIENGRQHIYLHTLFLLADAVDIHPANLLPEIERMPFIGTDVMGVHERLSSSVLPDYADTVSWVERIIHSKIKRGDK